MKIKATHSYEFIYKSPQGKITTRRGRNLIPIVGLNLYITRMWITPASGITWYAGIVAASALYSANDTMSSHGGWTEDIGYLEPTRSLWSPGTVVNGSVSNAASPFTYTFSGALRAINGFFIVSDSGKGGTTGSLGGEATFAGGPIDVDAGGTGVLTLTVSVVSV